MCFHARRSIFLLLIFIKTTTFAKNKDHDQQYLSCTNTGFHCGNFHNLSYPFWGPNRPNYCGHPEFELKHCSGDAPEILINSISYRVLGIALAEYKLTVVRTDFWNDVCPDDPQNGTLSQGSSSFTYDLSTQDLTLYYRCPLSATTNISADLGQFNCREEESRGFTNFFATYFMSWSPSATASIKTCNQSVVIRISDTAAHNLKNSTIPRNLTAEISSGFQMDWDAENSRCDLCRWSGGLCGSHNITKEFTCYCKDRSYLYLCGSNNSGTNSASSSKRNLAIGVAGAVFMIMIFSMGIICYHKREWISSKEIIFWNKNTTNELDVEALIKNYGSFAPKRYSYSNVKKMTNSFEEKIGKGGFGAVFKGKLPDGHLVAVKILSDSKGNGEEFINEVASIGRTSHVNVVTLLGFCYEKKKRALVYEYMPNGSLDKFIFNHETSNANSHLKWKTLYEIAIGIARGLEYLHRGCTTRILHFDIKPHNILLDKDFCPKISDFGLAKLWLRKESIMSMVEARGTIGYIAPEVFSRTYGGVSHKSDVYSYGMLVLEMVGGRKNFDSAVSHTSQIYYPNRIYKELEMGNEASILGNLTEEEKETSKKMILVSFWCIQTNPSDRPSMSKVVDMLEGSLQSIESPPKPYLFSPTRSPPQSSRLSP